MIKNFSISILQKKISLLNLTAFLASLVIVLALFCYFTPTTLDIFFSSDTLYLPSIYKDLFVDNGELKHWNLNPSPNFFPDMLVYFPLMYICENNFIWSSFLFAIVQYLFLMYCLSLIVKTILPNYSKSYLSLPFITLYFILIETFVYTKDFVYSFFLISNSFHTSCFVFGILNLYFAFLIIKKPNIKLLFINFLIALLCIISDRLFIVLYTAPIFLSFIYFAVIKGNKFHYWFLALQVIAVILGLKIFEWIESSGIVHFDDPHKMLAFDSIESSFNTFKEQITIYMSEFSFKSISLYSFLVSFICLIYLFIKKFKHASDVVKLYILFFILYSVGVIMAPIVNGSYTGWDILRYNIYPVYLSGLHFAVFIALNIKSNFIKTTGKYALLLTNISALVYALTLISLDGFNNYINYYPKIVETLDDFSEKENLKCGVANYWVAKKTTLFSKNKVKLYPVFEDLGAYTHVTNEDWFFKNQFDFVVLNGFNDTTTYKNKIILEQQLNLTNNIILAKTKTFTYNRDKGFAPVVN